MNTDWFWFRMFEIPVLGPRIKRKVVERTGKQQESELLRRYTKQRFGVDVGMYTYGSCFCDDFALGGEVLIGKYCSIASNVHYFGDGHPTEWLSTSPYFYNTLFNGNRKKVKHVSRGKLVIGNDCWIGYGTVITKECRRIGNGAVIGAGAVVTRDVPPYAVVGGVPAKVIKYRFDGETIKRIENAEWWEKTPEEILVYSDYVSDPEAFLREMENGHNNEAL